MIKKIKNLATVNNLIIIITYIAFFIVCAFLHIKQMTPHDMVYMSDMPAHYNSFTTGKGYSYMAFIVYPIAAVFGENGFAVLVSVFNVLTVYCTSIILIKLFGIRRLESVLLGTLISIEAAVWLPCDGYLYRYTLTSSTWHNSTYTFMEPFTLIAILELCYLIENMNEKVLEKKFLYRSMLFSLFLALATCAKPSFLFGLAPALLILLIVHFLKYRAQYFMKELVVGLAVLPAVGVAISQGGELSAGGGGGLAWMPGILWNPLTFIGYSSLLRSMAFIIAVSICYYKECVSNNSFLFLWLLCIVGYVEAVCIVQPNPEILYHGNVTWTASICLLPLYIYSVGIMIREFLCNRNRIKMMICSGFFLWHTITGAYFLYIMVMGGRYDLPLVY